MNKGAILKHVLIRIVVFIALVMVSVFIGLATLNPTRRCGTGDVLAFIPWFLGFYILWSLWLVIELFYFQKVKQRVKKKTNLILVLILPVFFVLLWGYLELVN